MTWVKLDDSFADHPKVLQAGLPAVGLYVIALAHSSRHLTDGHITDAFVDRSAGRQAGTLAQALVTAGLWTRNGDGWDIHDYLDFNPSRDTILQRRRQDSSRKRTGSV